MMRCNAELAQPRRRDLRRATLLSMTATVEIPLIRPREGSPVVCVELAERERTGPERERSLAQTSLSNDMSARRLAAGLRGKVDIRQGYEGAQRRGPSQNRHRRRG